MSPYPDFRGLRGNSVTLDFKSIGLLIYYITQRHVLRNCRRPAWAKKHPTVPPTPAPTSCRGLIKTAYLHSRDNSNAYKVYLLRGRSDYPRFDGQKLSTPQSTSCRWFINMTYVFFQDKSESYSTSIFHGHSDYPQIYMKIGFTLFHPLEGLNR